VEAVYILILTVKPGNVNSGKISTDLAGQNGRKFFGGLLCKDMVNDFLIDMDAKGKAYSFILETGLFSQYIEYCLNGEAFGDIGKEQVN
jgi:hypothetical protein